ncbi:MAG: NAD(P)-binding protein [Streptosporangiales bacterium]|nr:NAD(P)-binding protein [Streptosporangiales bacterium]
MPDTPRPEQLDVVIVGAGFSGMYMLYRLRELGMSARVIEAGSGVGGTWYWNRYPGARCDVESMDYSYSFSPELEQEWEWTERYPAQPEILRYAEHVADRFDLRRDMVFETRVSSAHYDEAADRWLVRTDTGHAISARFCVMATGCLSVPKWPEVDGVEEFAGRTFHTGRWPHEGVDFTGRRVGVIGTGSSAIQSIPQIAAQASAVTVFQRTANFSMPAHNRPLSKEEQADLKARYREYRQAARESFVGVPRPLPTRNALDVSHEERVQTYSAGWDYGGLFGLTGAYLDTRLSEEANETAAEFVRSKIREIVSDPEVARRLSPYDHPLGTKRPCVDTGYYKIYNEPHVDLVDVRATPITKVTPTGVQTSDATYEFDDLVFATGFDAMTGALNAIDIRGRDGAALKEKWAEGPRTYLGVSVAGFPNLFMITGPGSPSVLSNMMVSIEQHVEWVSDCLGHLKSNGLSTIEPTDEAENAWVEHVNEVGAATLYPKANSWYMGANVPGKPRVFMPYVGGVGPYREHCTRIAAEGYTGFVLA